MRLEDIETAISERLFCRLNPQFFELFGDVVAMGTGIHFFVDMQNFPVFADVDRPPKREFTFLSDDTIGFCHFFSGIA